jgi:hypothetical protein
MWLPKQSHNWQTSDDAFLESIQQMGWIDINANHLFTAELLHHHTVTAVEARVDYLNMFLAKTPDFLSGQICRNS